MLEIAVIEDPATAEISLEPTRTRILKELSQPGSATSLAGKLGLPRQKVNYHLKALERCGLVDLVVERRKGNVTERIVQATAASYLISPQALAAIAPDPHRFADRFSAFWLLSLAGRMVQEMGILIAGAAAAKQKLPTFAIDGEITFRSAADRAAFAADLGVAITELVDKYHDAGAHHGRQHRLVIALHPALKAAKIPPGDAVVADPDEPTKPPTDPRSPHHDR